MSEATDIDVVLFDVGGVIVRMDDIATLGPLNGVSDSAAIRALWLDCPIVQAHERGEINAAEFGARMVETYRIAGEPEDFLVRFCDWPREVFPGVEETLAAIDSRVRIACLSNTSDIHWRTQIARDDLHRLFKRQFLSFELGAVKPDPEIFRRVAREMGVAPHRVLYFDDHEANVDGARAVGFHAHRVAGIDEARVILRRYGLLPPR